MSHVAAVECEVSDLDALEEAAAECGLELVRGQKKYKWFGKFLADWSDKQRAAALRGYDPKNFGKCEHALRVKGKPEAYEIGLMPRLDGEPGWTLIYDTYSSGHRDIEAVAGKDLLKLVVEYSTTAGMKAMAKKGYRMEKKRTENGGYQVIALKA